MILHTPATNKMDDTQTPLFFCNDSRKHSPPQICLDNKSALASRPNFNASFCNEMSTFFVHCRIMTNGSLPRDKTKFLFESSTTENSDPAPQRVVQSPRTKIKTTCSYTINRVSLSQFEMSHCSESSFFVQKFNIDFP